MPRGALCRERALPPKPAALRSPGSAKARRSDRRFTALTHPNAGGPEFCYCVWFVRLPPEQPPRAEKHLLGYDTKRQRCSVRCTAVSEPPRRAGGCRAGVAANELQLRSPSSSPDQQSRFPARREEPARGRSRGRTCLCREPPLPPLERFEFAPSSSAQKTEECSKRVVCVVALP